ncbi:hypothetical protein BC937DRAFT_92027 [Endogone sp. FLAS-F59071]|nr:hypothetical protein BC937DRAFT_92027 [Endogone sp. FLAS-F59071]|eukprot:RUS15764.1 hypothetical protein BC937DRAFT_92027 [Endogone sp. FLAS-F59071]
MSSSATTRPNYEDLRKVLPATGDIILKYGDMVSIADDVDITIAVAYSNVLKVIVFDKETIPLPPSEHDSIAERFARLSLGRQSLASLRVELVRVRDTLNEILDALPSEGQGGMANGSGGSGDSASDKLAYKALSTTDMAELLESRSASKNIRTDPVSASAPTAAPVAAPTAPSDPAPQTNRQSTASYPSSILPTAPSSQYPVLPSAIPSTPSQISTVPSAATYQQQPYPQTPTQYTYAPQYASAPQFPPPSQSPGTYPTAPQQQQQQQPTQQQQQTTQQQTAQQLYARQQSYPPPQQTPSAPQQQQPFYATPATQVPQVPQGGYTTPQQQQVGYNPAGQGQGSYNPGYGGAPGRIEGMCGRYGCGERIGLIG